MSDRPILFSAPMVRAILNSTKTQTRRVVKPQPEWTEPATVWQHGDGHSGLGWYAHNDEYPEEGALHYRCPYGQPGSTLWVRETWRTSQMFDDEKPNDLPHWACLRYEADEKLCGAWAGYGYAGKLRPSIHMPRWASRITLEITGVRVERLQDISADDCWAEGIPYSPDVDPVHEYRDLWESINGPGSWDANPWVWVVEFKRLEGAA